MAKVTMTVEKFIRGLVGDRIYRIQNGKQIVYSKPNWNLTKTRTEAVLNNHTKFAALTSVSRAFEKVIKDTFEKDDRGSRMSGMFLKHNWDVNKAYLTRQEVADGTQVLENFYVSDGSLQNPITTYEQDGNLVSSICVGDLDLTPETTIDELSRAVFRYAQGFSEDYNGKESILFVRATQVPKGKQTPAHIEVQKSQVILKTCKASDPSPKVLGTVLPDGFSTVPVVCRDGQVRNFLCCPVIEGTGACWIHSRNVDGDRTICTTQQLHCAENPLLEEYTDHTAKVLAFNSYGGVNKHFSASPNNPVPEKPEEKPTLPNVPQGPSTLAQYTLYVLAKPAHGGKVTGSGKYAPSADVELTAAAAEGYDFIGWNDGFDEPTRTIQMPAAPTTYTAYFKAHEENGSGSNGSTGSGSTGNGTGSGNTGNGTGNTDPTKFTISGLVSPAGAGVVTVSPAQPVASGTQVTLSAVASSGKQFKQWDNGSTQNPLTVTATASKSYTAEFEDIPSGGNNGGSTSGGSGSDGEGPDSEGKVQVTVTGNITNGVEYLGSGRYTPGEQVQIQAKLLPTAEGLEFDGWNDGNRQNPRTITAPDRSITYRATFALVAGK